MTSPEYPCAHCPRNRKDWELCDNFRSCQDWKDWFFDRFARFNAYARKYGILPTTPPEPEEDHPDADRPMTLREARERIGMTQRTLAVEMGVAPSTVSLWERAKNSCPVERLSQLCRVLQIPENQLIL